LKEPLLPGACDLANVARRALLQAATLTAGTRGTIDTPRPPRWIIATEIEIYFSTGVFHG
jgi:hypothetical protein